MANKDSSKAQNDSDDFKSVFEKYAKTTGKKGKILLQDAKKWLENAKFIGKKTGKTESEFEESFAKVAKDKVSMSYEEFKAYIHDFAKDMKVEVNEFTKTLVAVQDKINSKDIKDAFEEYTKAAGNKGKLLLEDAKKWFQNTKFIGEKPGKTESEFYESFAKVAKDKVSMSYEEFKTYTKNFAKDMKMEIDEFTKKLVDSWEKMNSKDIKDAFQEYTEVAGNKGKLMLEDTKKMFEKVELIDKKQESSESEFEESFEKVIEDKVSPTYDEFQAYSQTAAKDMEIEVDVFLNKLAASQTPSQENPERE